MFCSNCGSHAPENSPYCPTCGQMFAQPYPPTPYPTPNPNPPYYPRSAPPDHMVWSILVTLFCCQPFGIIAIINASKVNGAVARGDYATAEQASRKAQNWCVAGLIGWFIAVILYVLFCVALAVAEGEI